MSSSTEQNKMHIFELMLHCFEHSQIKAGFVEGWSAFQVFFSFPAYISQGLDVMGR